MHFRLEHEILHPTSFIVNKDKIAKEQMASQLAFKAIDFVTITHRDKETAAGTLRHYDAGVIIMSLAQAEKVYDLLMSLSKSCTRSEQRILHEILNEIKYK